MPGKHLLHRVIMDAATGVVVDHRDGDKLNNQRSNLRECTVAQNKQNTPKSSAPKTSRFKGVSWHTCGKWQAAIKSSGKSCYLGLFKSEEEAARAYDVAAREKFGAFARTNFSDGGAA